MFIRMFNGVCSLSPEIQRSLVKTLYQGLSDLDKDGQMIFMNFGYAELGPYAKEVILKDADEINRYCIQMYHHVVSAVEVAGQDVLEVGCGRGGGASYVTRYLQPKSLVGIDLAEKAVAFCNQRHALENLRFQQGEAESLPFDDQSFDRIVNIESSHCYADMDRFLREVYRALRPGGYFLFADYRDTRSKMNRLREQLFHSDLEVIKEEKINDNVLQALELDNTRKVSLIRQKVPWFLRPTFHIFAGMRGTEAYKRLETGDFDYRSFVLHKRA